MKHIRAMRSKGARETSGKSVQIEGIQSCPLCNTPVGPAPECPECELPQDLSQQQLCPRGHVNGITWKFCKACGAKLVAA